MKNPPAGVKLVMEAVCVMLEKAPERKIDPATQKPVLDYWPTSVRLLADMDFRKVSETRNTRRKLCTADLCVESSNLRQRKYKTTSDQTDSRSFRSKSVVSTD